MQSLESLLAAPSQERDAAPSPQKNSGRAPADDFGRVMQRALQAKQKDSPHEAALRAEKKHLAAARNSLRPENNPPVSTAEKTSGKDSPADAAGDAETSARKTAAEQNSKNSDDSFLPAMDLPDATPPVVLPLPVTACFVSPQTSADFLAAAKVKTGVTAISMNESGGGGAATAATLVAAGKTKSLAAELSPTTTGTDSTSQKTGAIPDAAAAGADGLLKNAAALADKNLLAIENAKLAAGTAPAQKASELGTAGAAALAVEKSGTGVATVELPMKKTSNTNKVAGLDGPVLPGDAALMAQEKVLPVSMLAGPVRAAKDNSADNLADSNINLTLPDAVTAVDFSTAQGALILPALTDAKMRNLERTHDMVALHAVRLVEAQTDTLSVVIKPGAGTELSLELRQRNGGIEAHAVLSRGDFQLMNQHWPELQQRLEQRGIRLAPLGGEANFSTDGGGSFKQQQQSSSREAEAQKASAFAEFALAGRSLGATARLAVGGWESWA